MVCNRKNFLLREENFWLSSLHYESLHYGNILFSFLFHLEGELPTKTALKFQQYYPIVNKVKYLFPKLSTVEKLLTSNIKNINFIIVQIS